MSTNARRPLVAVVGDGSFVGAGSATREALAESVGRALIDHGYRVLTGGLGGVMAAASRGARASARYAPGDTVAALPGHDPGAANEWVDVALATGLGHLRNTLCAHADAVVAVGGGAGTLTELAYGWILDRLLIGLRCPGWSGRLADQPIDHRRRFQHIADDCVRGADTGEEAAALVDRWLGEYRATSRGSSR